MIIMVKAASIGNTNELILNQALEDFENITDKNINSFDVNDFEINFLRGLRFRGWSIDNNGLHK